jgi:hypothetical protein
MQDAEYDLRRIPLLRASVNKGKRKAGAPREIRRRPLSIPILNECYSLPAAGRILGIVAVIQTRVVCILQMTGVPRVRRSLKSR